MGDQVRKSLDLRNRVKNERIEDATIKTVSESVKIIYLDKDVTKYELKIDKNKSMTIKIIELPTK